MPHRYPLATRLLPAACLALAAPPRPVAAQSTELLPPRQVPLHLAPPDSLAQLPKTSVSNLLVDKALGIYICPAPASNIFFPFTTVQPLLSRAAGVQVTPGWHPWPSATSSGSRLPARWPRSWAARTCWG